LANAWGMAHSLAFGVLARSWHPGRRDGFSEGDGVGVSGLIVASGGALVMTPSGELVRGRNAPRHTPFSLASPTPSSGKPATHGPAAGINVPSPGGAWGHWLPSPQDFKAACTRADKN